MNGSAGIPIHPDEVTRPWLEMVLKAPSGALRGFTYEPVGTGQVASSFRLKLDWTDGEFPPSLVLKSPSMDEKSRQTGLGLGLYAKEVGWYQQLAPSAGVRCPLCYGAFIEGDRFALLLEDCAPARQGDQLGGASISDLSKCLAEAAHLHGAFFNDPALETLDLVKVDPAAPEMLANLFKRSWAPFKKRYQARLGADIVELGDAFLNRHNEYLKHKGAAFSISHKDFRIDNMLFGKADERVVILDWQTLGRGIPMADVAYLLGTSIASRAERKREERGLVDRYLAHLEAMNVRFDADAMWKDYRVQSAAGFIMAVMSSMLVVRTERGDELFAVMAERSAWQMMDLESLSLT